MGRVDRPIHRCEQDSKVMIVFYRKLHEAISLLIHEITSVEAFHLSELQIKIGMATSLVCTNSQVQEKITQNHVEMSDQRRKLSST